MLYTMYIVCLLEGDEPNTPANSFLMWRSFVLLRRGQGHVHDVVANSAVFVSD